jgi:hypothetical protein
MIRQNTEISLKSGVTILFIGGDRYMSKPLPDIFKR